MRKKKRLGLLNKIVQYFSKENKKDDIKLKFHLEIVKENPICPSNRMKLAEIYYKKGQKKKAVSESIMAAEIFCNTGYYRKGLAIYKRLLKEQPWLDHVKLKLANIYRQMGFPQEASSLYFELYNDYTSMGLKHKAVEIGRFINDLDPQKVSKSATRHLGTKESENALETQSPNGNMPQNILDLFMGDEKESFYDLAAALESDDV
jgi:tetratricopeptide (TPR) repeat protein